MFFESGSWMAVVDGLDVEARGNPLGEIVLGPFRFVLVCSRISQVRYVLNVLCISQFAEILSRRPAWFALVLKTRTSSHPFNSGRSFCSFCLLLAEAVADTYLTVGIPYYFLPIAIMPVDFVVFCYARASSVGTFGRFWRFLRTNFSFLISVGHTVVFNLFLWIFWRRLYRRNYSFTKLLCFRSLLWWVREYDMTLLLHVKQFVEIRG